MMRSHVQALRPLLRPSGAAGNGYLASLEGQAVRRTFTSRSQPTLQTPFRRINQQSSFNSLKRPSKPASRSAPRRSFHNTSQLRDANPTPKEAPKEAPKDTNTKEPQGLSARLKKLSREYGWSALGVYLALSVLDFPFCFLLVRTVGTDRIGKLEHWIVSNAKKLVPQSVQDKWHEYQKALKQAEMENLGNDDISEHVEMAGWGVQEADARNKAEASLGTQLALAYAIHKSFIFVRVPLTAAVTPKVVKMLRSWGWNIGKRRSKP
ncbi:hypothetical protein F4778DRAFT_514215 [Xylariomycetidae sp. FL2044]|nr:hypothetical protein F4778DRAFT_514215 [Xylariomycetidae sp. FL2044]